MKYDQPTTAPVPKVAAVGIAGAVVTAIVLVLALFGVIIPEDVSGQAEAGITALVVLVSAVQAIIQFAAGYIKRDER